jgi:hypothetical protein
LFFCVLFFTLIVFGRDHLCPMLPMYLSCQLFTTPSVLYYVYYLFGSLLRLLPLRFSITFITPSVLYYVYYPFGSLLRLLPLRFSLTFILFVDMIHDICLLFMKITVPN